MAEKVAVDPVRLFLQDEMYPRFNFLKQRLLCIHRRFKAVNDGEILVDLIPNDKQLMQDIERRKDTLKDTVAVYLIGNHRTISEKSMKTVFIASSTYHDKEESTTKKSMSDVEFKKLIKNVAEYPRVIVHIERVKQSDTTKSFEVASRQLLSILPEAAWKSCVLCTENCDEFCILDDFRVNTSLSDHVSLGKLIQSCLEDKVVRVLRLMAHFIQNPVLLTNIEDKALVKYQIISKIGFEINGVFRQAKLSVSPTIPRMSSALQEKILSINGVYGCGIMYGKLVVHLKEKATVDMKEVTEKIIKVVTDSDNKNLINNLDVTRVRVSTNAGITHEGGKRIRVKIQPSQDSADGAAATHSYGTLGCFVKGCKNGATGKMYALSCAHVFPKGCDAIVEIGRTQSTSEFDVFGKVSPQLKLSKKHTIDIAAIAVDESVETKCNVKLKNSHYFDAWENVLHKGDLKELIGTQVYKWGSASNLTRGLITSNDYKTVDGLDEQYNIYIGSLPGSSETDFSCEGDSGTAVCFDEPTEEKVNVLSLVIGPLTDTQNKKTICCYSCHLQTNIQELTRMTGFTFELYN